MKIQLVENWKSAWRWWSVRYALVVGAGVELVYRLAEAVETILPALSQPVLDNLPPWLRAASAVGAFFAVALRLIRQKDAPK